MAEARAAGGAMAVLFVGNDHFEQITDTLGPAAGDAVLVAVAQRIGAQLRPTDLVARFEDGGFAVLLTPVCGADDAARIADQILQAVTEPVVLADGGQLAPGVRIGMVLFPEQGQTAGALLSAADAAMYHSRSQRRSGRPAAAAA